ncbi:MAG TPA: serine hydrolase domain-containing protein [Nocardioidaceae bacterium]|nr:serine hydrolase domain-containing protein [Nocardioidaceae bacterium]
MENLETSVTRVATEHEFSGAVLVDVGKRTELTLAFGLADRAHGVPNTPKTQFALASAVKGMTALTVMRLVEDGYLELGTTARSLLGTDLPEVHDAVTVEDLLAHRSGIGDYLDEDDNWDVADYVLAVPVHELASTQAYLRVLDGYPQKFAPGVRFSYCNGGYVVLALMAERAGGAAFQDLVARLVCEPAGMTDTEFLRSDELPGRAARGYLEPHGLRTNVLHLPVRGSGDGGVYSTVADVHALWRAFLGGRIVSPASAAEMLRPRSDSPEDSRRYGLGFWLGGWRDDAVSLEGYDPGVSCVSVHARADGITFTVVSNTSEGAWPVARHLAEVLLGPAPRPVGSSTVAKATPAASQAETTGTQ